MSLVRIALRIAGVLAMKDRTDVGPNVLNSQFGALDVGADNTIRTDQQKPFLSLYTDGARAGDGANLPETTTIDVRSLMPNGLTDLVIEAGITAAMVQSDPVTDEDVVTGLGVPATDENLETQLDIILRQAGNALTDPDNEWAQIFCSLIIRFVRFERVRAGSAEGQRAAAHQMRITAELIDDPLFGEPLDPEEPMARFLAKAAAVENDENLAAIANKIAGLVGGNDPAWLSLQRRHGLTREELLALGRGPLADDVNRETPVFGRGIVDVDGHSPDVEVTP